MRQLRCSMLQSCLLVFGDASLPIFYGASLSLRHPAAKAGVCVTPIASAECRRCFRAFIFRLQNWPATII